MESTKDTALPSKRCLNKIKSIAVLTDVYVEKNYSSFSTV